MLINVHPRWHLVLSVVKWSFSMLLYCGINVSHRSTELSSLQLISVWSFVELATQFKLIGNGTSGRAWKVDDSRDTGPSMPGSGYTTEHPKSLISIAKIHFFPFPFHIDTFLSISIPLLLLKWRAKVERASTLLFNLVQLRKGLCTKFYSGWPWEKLNKQHGRQTHPSC